MDHENNIPVGLAFIAPSITPMVYVRNGVNPSFRKYEYNHINRTIMNYSQYYLPLDKIIGMEEDEDDQGKQKFFSPLKVVSITILVEHSFAQLTKYVFLGLNMLQSNYFLV